MKRKTYTVYWYYANDNSTSSSRTAGPFESRAEAERFAANLANKDNLGNVSIIEESP